MAAEGSASHWSAGPPAAEMSAKLMVGCDERPGMKSRGACGKEGGTASVARTHTMHH